MFKAWRIWATRLVGVYGDLACLDPVRSPQVLNSSRVPTQKNTKINSLLCRSSFLLIKRFDGKRGAPHETTSFAFFYTMSFSGVFPIPPLDFHRNYENVTLLFSSKDWPLVWLGNFLSVGSHQSLISSRPRHSHSETYSPLLISGYRNFSSLLRAYP